MYQPKFPPFGVDVKGLTQYVSEELQSVAQAQFDATDAVLLSVLNRSPTRPRAGQVVCADGTNWNPGSGAGAYVYVGGAWAFLGGTGGGGADILEVQVFT